MLIGLTSPPAAVGQKASRALSALAWRGGRSVPEWLDGNAAAQLMNKAFTKEEDDDVFSDVVPARPPLPTGTPNYVTARGLALLNDELKHLEVARAASAAIQEESARRRQLARLTERMSELSARIGSARVVEHRAPFPEEVRFGAKVRVRDEEHRERAYQIVGVDEADAAHARYSFVAPVSRALLGKRVGDVVTLRTPRGEEQLELLSIEYGPPG